jgi:hypothetical protein
VDITPNFTSQYPNLTSAMGLLYWMSHINLNNSFTIHHRLYSVMVSTLDFEVTWSHDFPILKIPVRSRVRPSLFLQIPVQCVPSATFFLLHFSVEFLCPFLPSDYLGVVFFMFLLFLFLFPSFCLSRRRKVRCGYFSADIFLQLWRHLHLVMWPTSLLAHSSSHSLAAIPSQRKETEKIPISYTT